MISQIDNCNELSDKIELKGAIALRALAQCDVITDKCMRDSKFTSLEVNNSFLLNLPNYVGRPIFDGWQRFWKSPFASLIATCRNFHIESFMRTIVVIGKSPLVKSFLNFLISPGERLTQYFCLKCSVKPFIFSKSLRMDWRA